MKGMTLLEVLLVIALTAIIVVTGVFGYGAMQTSLSLRSAGDEIRSQLQLGRELAIANMNGVAYRIKSSGGVVILFGGDREIKRFQMPVGISSSPSVFDWGFSSVTGSLIGCSLPCTIGLSARGGSELITIRANGIVD